MATSQPTSERSGRLVRPNDLVFTEAFAAARAGYSDGGWESLTPRERTEAIYREMRRLDQDRIGSTGRDTARTATRRLKLVTQPAAE